jgi:hypothetical protein
MRFGSCGVLPLDSRVIMILVGGVGKALDTPSALSC